MKIHENTVFLPQRRLTANNAISCPANANYSLLDVRISVFLQDTLAPRTQTSGTASRQLTDGCAAHMASLRSITTEDI